MADLPKGGRLSCGPTGTFAGLDRFFVARGFGLCFYVIMFDFPWIFRLHCGQNKPNVLSIEVFNYV